jgi:hypothetical protein
VQATKAVSAALMVFASARGLAQEHQPGTAEKLGEIHFAISCTEAAQREFNHAVALLHSFQFSRAIEGFSVVLGEDPTCSIEAREDAYLAAVSQLYRRQQSGI